MDYVLVSQIFPPEVGGSGVLLQNVYSRIRGAHVTALVDIDVAQQESASSPGMRLVPTRIDSRAWGLGNPRDWFGQVKLARALYRLAAHDRAIVHCGRAQPEGVPAMLAGLMPGGPRYVFWVHGEDIAAALSSRQFAAAMRLVYRRAEAAIANSRNTAQLIEATGWLRGPVHVVYPGVDSQRFRPDADDGTLRRMLAPRGELLLLSVARLQKRKGHDLVLRALPALKRVVPNIRYIIAGDGGERQNLQHMTAELGLTGDVFFAGKVADELLPAYFAACDVFVLPTRMESSDFEGFGIVFLEAAAAGKPTVGGRNGGVPEAIAEGQTGMLITEEHVEELLEALKTLCSSQDLRQRMGSAGRDRATRDFTWERAAAAVAEIQQELQRPSKLL